MNQKVEDRRLTAEGDEFAVQQQIRADVSRMLSFGSVLLLGLHLSATVSPLDTMSLPLQLLFIAALILSLKRCTTAMVLALIQIPLFLSTSHSWDHMPTIDDVLIGLQVLILMALISRLHRFSSASSSSAVSSSFKTLKLLFGKSEQTDQQREQNMKTLADAVGHFLISMLILIGAMLGVTVVASFVLQLVPMDPAFRSTIPRVYGLEPTAFRLFVLGGVLFVCVLVSWLIVTEVNFRRLSVREASMYLRSQLVGWLHRDFRVFARKHRREKKNRKRL